MSRLVGRRQFLATAAGTAGAALALPEPGRRRPGASPERLLRVAVLAQPGFPAVDAAPPAPAALGAALEGFSVEYLACADLDARLVSGGYDVLLTPYGSAFPVDQWPALLRYLLAGGNWVNVGGAPVAVPVTRRGGAAWEAGDRKAEYQRRLGFVLACAVDATAVREWRACPGFERAAALATGVEARTVWELYCRFSSVPDTPDESGSAGPREAAVWPLVSGVDAAGRAVAAPFVCVDRLERDFAGGRWVFATHDGPVAAPALRALVEAAAVGAERFEARPSFACLRRGERPAVTATYRGRPAAGTPFAGEARLRVFDDRGAEVGRAVAALRGTWADASGAVDLGGALAAALAPGLYRVEATLALAGDPPRSLRHTTGFWIWDETLLAGGTALVAGRDGFARAGSPYPVAGTTYMASDVHRKFLDLPNPWLWDRDFAAMKAAGVNLVRTGIWTGWKRLMSEPGKLDEGALRALDAWLLTARRHDIPVIFTLFAFLPETWGGENPYLGPAALEAQRSFVSAIARRYRRMKDLAWDLINEPSFCNKDHLWSCRPSYDGFERAAWAAWLRERRVVGPDGAPPALPSLDDFDGSGAGTPDAGRTLRVMEYRLFAQAQFARWARFMTGVLRAASPRQLVTVGQDEAGTRDSPNNLFLAPDLDFTCVHTWWLNDDIAWDEVMTKAPGRLNLVEETGVMFAGRPPGIEPRWEAYARDLLERKMALALGVAGGAGFVEWLWNSNCYMPSDNEAAIGLLRADGTAKPELDAFVGIAGFVSRARLHLVGRRDPDVLLVVPHANMFSLRDTATDATKRAVRTLLYDCRVGVACVSEYAAAPQLSAPRLVVVPGPRILTHAAWAALLAWARRGSTVLVTGPVEADERGRAVERLAPLGIDAGDRAATAPVERPLGRGVFLWDPEPVELSGDQAATAALYARALRRARVAPGFTVEGADAATLVHMASYQAADLFTVVAGPQSPARIRVHHRQSGRTFDLPLTTGRASLLLVGRATGRELARYGVEGTGAG